MCNGFNGDDTVAFGFLALIKFLCRFAIAHRKIGRFDICTCQIPVAILGVAAALLLAVGQVRTADTAAVRNIVPGTSKAFDFACSSNITVANTSPMPAVLLSSRKAGSVRQ